MEKMLKNNHTYHFPGEKQFFSFFQFSKTNKIEKENVYFFISTVFHPLEADNNPLMTHLSIYLKMAESPQKLGNKK